MKLQDHEGLRLSWDDVQRKFNQTYIFASHPKVLKGVPTVLFLDNADGNVITMHWRDPSVKGQVGQLAVFGDEIEVKLVFPPIMGAVPDGNSVLFLRRNPARQWQVGACRANLLIWDQNGGTLHPTLTVCQTIFTPAYENVDYLEVLQRFERDPSLQAFALNSTYWFVRKADKIILNRNQTALGSFLFGTFFVNKACTDLRQELWDDLKIKVSE